MEKYKVFLVNDYRASFILHDVIDVLLFDNTDRVKIEGDAIGCVVHVGTMFDDSTYKIERFNDIEDTHEFVSKDERVEIVETVKKFLTENPIDTINFGEFY